MRRIEHTPIDDDAETDGIRPLEACVSLSTEGTNDVDTLRQLISQSLPQLLNSCVSFLSTFISMLVLDIPLTVISLVLIGVMLFASSKLGSLSGKYFVRQQIDLGNVNAYIEEMMEGQKVVKVFCHEEKSLEQFRDADRRNSGVLPESE